MRNLKIAVARTPCFMVALSSTLAAGRDMPEATSKTDGDTVSFPDKHEFLVLPRKGEAGAVECAVYPPRLPGSGKNAGLVMHLYGAGGSCQYYNMMRPSYAIVRQLLWERGYWLVVPSLGGEHWMNDAAVTSLDVIIEGMIRDSGVDPARVNILGTSMGGGSGLVYVMRHPGRVRSICAIFPMTDFAQWVKESPQYLQDIAGAHGVKPSEAASLLEMISPLNHVSAFADVPVFLIHGDADPTVPVHHSRKFAAALRKQDSPVTYHEVRGLEHTDAVAEPFQREIVEFLTGTAAQSD